MSTILIINGPNLNLLGTREPDKYGETTLEQVVEKLKEIGAKNNIDIIDFQSNSESELIDFIHSNREVADFGIINPAAFTHTSIALRDAMLATAMPFIEVHISNIHKREDFRKDSYFSDIALGTIAGLGAQGYELAMLAAVHHLSNA